MEKVKDDFKEKAVEHIKSARITWQNISSEELRKLSRENLCRLWNSIPSYQRGVDDKEDKD